MKISSPVLERAAVLLGRFIFAAVFAMAMTFKFTGIHNTATYIAASGFPVPLFLAWVAAFFELALVVCFLSGALSVKLPLQQRYTFSSSALPSMDHRVGAPIKASSVSSLIISYFLPVYSLRPSTGRATCS